MASNAVALAQGASNNVTFRNRIINGGMVVNQRATTVTNTAAWVYTVDRFAVYGSQASKFTTAQSSTAPAGFYNSLLLTSSSAYSITSSDEFLLKQPIEGYNVADLNWGSSNAKTVVLSFWVQSSLTGLFSGNLRNATNDRCYVFSYTITSANTWQQITLTIPGDTSGTWVKDNGVGIAIWWTIGTGSTYLGTAGSWGTTAYDGATGTTSLVGTSGATLYITGVQLEAGSTASPFEYRQYTTELQLCQRYYYLYVTGANSTNGVNACICTGAGILGNYMQGSIVFPTTMRTVPTLVSSTGSNYYQLYSGSPASFNSISGQQFTPSGCTLLNNGVTISSGAAAIVYTTSASASIALTAEL
jgi:hypothetical protein